MRRLWPLLELKLERRKPSAFKTIDGTGCFPPKATVERNILKPVLMFRWGPLPNLQSSKKPVGGPSDGQDTLHRPINSRLAIRRTGTSACQLSFYGQRHSQ
jgi:hypothetical protein